MGLFESIVSTIAGLVAVFSAIPLIVSWWKKRRINKKNGSHRIPKSKASKEHAPSSQLRPPSDLYRHLVPLVKIAYTLLRLDRLPNPGNWGFTINKYIELNYPNDQDILSRKDTYLLEGSITHTAHALRGLSFLSVSIPGIEPDLIRRWVDLNSTEIGLVSPSLPANPDEVIGLAKEIRHTSTAILSLLRLKPHLVSKDSIGEVESWTSARSRLLLGFANVWVHDPRMTYSYAYLIELFDILRHDPTYSAEKAQLDHQISHGLQELFNNFSFKSPYWCGDSHPETKIFYSLLILSRILKLPELSDHSGWTDKVCACLEDIGRTARAIDGVPLGLGAAGSRFMTADLGTTAAFLECCQLSYILGFPVERLVLKSFRWLEQSFHLFNDTSRNAITHSWESVLSLYSILSIGDHFDFPCFFDKAEPILEDITEILNKSLQFPDKAVQHLGSITGYPEHFRLCFKRDIWGSSLKRRSMIRSNSLA